LTKSSACIRLRHYCTKITTIGDGMPIQIKIPKTTACHHCEEKIVVVFETPESTTGRVCMAVGCAYGDENDHTPDHARWFQNYWANKTITIPVTAAVFQTQMENWAERNLHKMPCDRDPTPEYTSN
jgi:hypothetical protein